MTVDRESQIIIGVSIEAVRKLLPLISLIRTCPLGEEKIFILLLLGKIIPIIASV
jgi:hypothetical protein